MYYRLTEQTKELVIGELRKFWANHPRYRDIVDNIQGKFSFDERPQYGIIVKTGNATKVQLAPDNYVGQVVSHVSLANVAGSRNSSLEWVREDIRAITDNNGVFPTQPGVYYGEITSPTEFHIDPLFYVRNESPLKVAPKTYQLLNTPVKGSVKVYEQPSNVYLIEGRDYNLVLGADGKPTGEILLESELPPKFFLGADYRYPGPSIGPVPFKPRFADNKTLPGCVLAFGRRAEVGDKFAVVVTEHRENSALEYGGKWELTVDMDITARDVYSQQEIADLTAVFLWGILRSQISGYGVDITDVSMGGESEEIYDENGDDYYYNSSLTMTLQSDWALYVPLHYKVRGISSLELKVREDLGLTSFEDPFFTSRVNYEKIQ